LVSSLSSNQSHVHLVQEIEDKHVTNKHLKRSEILNTFVDACFTDNILLNLIDVCLISPTLCEN